MSLFSLCTVTDFSAGALPIGVKFCMAVRPQLKTSFLLFRGDSPRNCWIMGVSRSHMAVYASYWRRFFNFCDFSLQATVLINMNENIVCVCVPAKPADWRCRTETVSAQHRAVSRSVHRPVTLAWWPCSRLCWPGPRSPHRYPAATRRCQSCRGKQRSAVLCCPTCTHTHTADLTLICETRSSQGQLSWCHVWQAAQCTVT